MNSFAGLNIVVHPYMDKFTFEQVVFPRSKKKRISKKFRKDLKNYKRKLVPEVYRVGNQICMGPLTKAHLDMALDTVERSRR